MDRLPLVPANETDHDVTHVIREVLQNALCKKRFPQNIVDNVQKYTLDGTVTLGIDKSALTVLELNQEAEKTTNEIQAVEEQLMQSHARVLMELNEELDFTLEESIKLKRRAIFDKLSQDAVKTFGLIQRADLFSDRVKHFLDFTLNPALHTCEKPCPRIKPIKKPTPSQPDPIPEKIPIISPPKNDIIFIAEPCTLIFEIDELNNIYKKKFKLRNVTPIPQRFVYTDFPQNSRLQLTMSSGSLHLAPGMYAEFLVTFKPKTYKNFKHFLFFKTPNGRDTVVTVISARESPTLSCYLFNIITRADAMLQPQPQSQLFSERRCNALNFTIDCGTCLLGNYTVVTLMMRNEGPRGRFFIAAEYEWFFAQIDRAATRPLELVQGSFSIFPTYFEIDQGGVGEIFILFMPRQIEFYTEKILFICDNNSSQEVEIVGDCIGFMNSYLKVDMYLVDNRFNYENRCLTVTATVHEPIVFILSVTNESPLYLKYYWALKMRNSEEENKRIMDTNWIRILNNTECLPSFSTTDFVVQITPNTEEVDCFYTLISFYIRKIPIESMPKLQSFVVRSSEQNLKENCSCCSSTDSDNSTNSTPKSFDTFADVHICELEVNCITRKPPSLLVLAERIKDQTVVKKPKKASAILRVSRTVLNFGVIPKGVVVSKIFSVQNLLTEDVEWKIAEIHIKNDMKLSLLTETRNLSCTGGLLGPHQKLKIRYKIEAKDCVRWISVLLIFASPARSDVFYLDSIMMVTYQVSEIDVTIHTDSSDFPVLSAKHLLHIGVPSLHSIYLHNVGVLTGCFYFLKAVGSDAAKVHIKFQPQSGVIPPGVCLRVAVELVALDYGIFDNLHVPCFTGDKDNIGSLRILCAVDGINVHFYLPHQHKGHMKVLWPPRAGTGTEWSSIFMKAEDGDEITEGTELQSSNFRALESVKSAYSLIAFNSVASTYLTVKMPQIFTRNPVKFTFLIENISTIEGNFFVEATNFGADEECVNNILVKAKIKSARDFWEKFCQSGYGIVVEPERSSGIILGHEVVKINLWVYANTWGSYLEEIIVEINDLTPFCFNLLIDAVGLPLEFPFAVNTILHEPTLRLGSIAYSSPTITRNVRIVNVSSVALQIVWHVFDHTEGEWHEELPFNVMVDVVDDISRSSTSSDTLTIILSSKYYGREHTQYLQVEPTEFTLEAQSSTMMRISLDPQSFLVSDTKKKLCYNLVGHYYLKDEDKFKENYFKRESRGDTKPVTLKVLGQLEMPELKLDLIKSETIIDVFVNDIIFKLIEMPRIYLVFKNADLAPIVFSVNVDKPFSIAKIRTSEKNFISRSWLKIEKDECIEIIVKCEMTYENLLEFSNFIYHEMDGTRRENLTNLISRITKVLRVTQKGESTLEIPLQLNLHFPHIQVKPAHVKFGGCLLYNTDQAILSIYNYSGSIVKFEVYKTSQHNDFEVKPNFGEIPRSTGVNKQFIDVVVYFTPRECKRYLETIRISTNIPHYYIDVIVSGHGSNNEKFGVN